MYNKNQEAFSKILKDIKNGINKTSYKFSQDYDVSRSSVERWLKRIKNGNESSLDSNGDKRKSYKEKRLKSFDWNLIQLDYNEGLTWREVSDKYKITIESLNQAKKIGLFRQESNHQKTKKRILKGLCEKRKHSAESKEKISRKRKEFLKNNPEKHPWRQSMKFLQPPCESLKKYLTQNGVEFKEEFYDESWSRSFQLDIALIDKKIAIEVNGNMHYNRDGTLKKYYVERENYLKTFGWELIQVHYQKCFKESDLKDILSIIINKQK